MPYEQELKTALHAAELAGKLILEHYARFKVIPDAPADISTDTDRQSQAMILQHIHTVFPHDALRAEEAQAALAGVPDVGARLWIIDPIDGTRGFARKNGEFSVMVAFVEAGIPAVGVVAEPAKQRLTYATRGAGCWKKDTNSDPVSCRVSQNRELQKATVVQSHSRKGASPSKELQALKPARVVETYSAGIKLAIVARGEADLYLNTYDACHDWDICAGQVLVEEAGGRVTNLRGQEPRYGLPGAVQAHGLLAGNLVLHKAAVEALASA
ncbi:MAG TPA: inositol monophosphatase family protein [Gemmataceae bacterium]|nr:inositol monophosphatase family protein [Gemmataceae bacterium]